VRHIERQGIQDVCGRNIQLDASAGAGQGTGIANQDRRWTLVQVGQIHHDRSAAESGCDLLGRRILRMAFAVPFVVLTAFVVRAVAVIPARINLRRALRMGFVVLPALVVRFAAVCAFVRLGLTLFMRFVVDPALIVFGAAIVIFARVRAACPDGLRREQRASQQPGEKRNERELYQLFCFHKVIASPSNNSESR